MKKIFTLSAFLICVITCCNAQQNDNSKVQFVSDSGNCQLIDKYLSQLTADKNFSGGLLIVKDREMIFNKGYGWANREKKIPFISSTLASMGSITKLFTAAAIMKLTEQNKLSVDDPLRKFFPTVPGDKAGITIHQLLTHSSGFHEFLKEDGGDYEKIETAGFLKRAFDEPLAFTPGEKAVYTNVGMSILGIIIEHVSGMDYEDFLIQNLFKPVGISGIGYHATDFKNENIAHGYQNGKDWGTIPQHISAAGNRPYWNLKANGGLEASLNDMFLWANAFTNNTILKKETIEIMFTPHIVEEGTNGNYLFGYGCNISKSRRNTKLIDNGGSNGIFFARMIRLSEEGVVFYMVTNESSINTNIVLPNVTQLYFKGLIEQDAMAAGPRFETPQAEKIYNILVQTQINDLSKELEKQGIQVDDDMILLDVGQRLIEEKKSDEALSLYQYYTKVFPNIVVAWNDMGDIYQMKGNKTEAVKCYEQALKLRPANARAKASLEKLKN